MCAFRKILVPTDFSDGSAVALKYACDLAERTNASVCILHAVVNPYPLGGYNEFYTVPAKFLESCECVAREQLESVLTPEERTRYRATLVLRNGGAAQQILLYLDEDRDVDLVVMATHGRGGVARLMMGSVADKIVRAARCPVVTLRRPEAEDANTRHAA